VLLAGARQLDLQNGEAVVEIELQDAADKDVEGQLRTGIEQDAAVSRLECWRYFWYAIPMSKRSVFSAVMRHSLLSCNIGRIDKIALPDDPGEPDIVVVLGLRGNRRAEAHRPAFRK